MLHAELQTEQPIWIRCPQDGQLEPHTGLSAAVLSYLVRPGPWNNYEPPVKSRRVKVRGNDPHRYGALLINPIDFDAIRAKHPLLAHLQALGIRLRRQGKAYVGRCPLHNEVHGTSLTVEGEHWRCWGKCDAHGDVIDFEQCYFNLPDLAEAARHLDGAELPSVDLPPPIRSQAPLPPPPYTLTGSDRDRMAAAAHALAKEPALIESVLGERPEFSLATVRGLALDGDLGFEDYCQWYRLDGPAILFGYSHGLKARWQAGTGGEKRPMRWLCGSPAGECWRQSLLRRAHQRIYLTEGEADAIAAVSSGLEEQEDCLVVALAGATIVPDSLPFVDKDVVLIPDPGDAGRTALEKLCARLEPIASSVAIIELAKLGGTT